MGAKDEGEVGFGFFECFEEGIEGGVIEIFCFFDDDDHIFALLWCEGDVVESIFCGVDGDGVAFFLFVA